MDDPYQVSPRNPDGSRGRGVVDPTSRGPHIGPIRITPTKVMLLIAVVGSTAFLAYAFTVREATQIPLLGAGLAVLGLVFSALAVTGVISTYRAASSGQPVRALGMAIFGGVSSIVALACFAFALVSAMVTRTTP